MGLITQLLTLFPKLEKLYLLALPRNHVFDVPIHNNLRELAIHGPFNITGNDSLRVFSLYKIELIQIFRKFCKKNYFQISKFLLIL